MTIYEEFLQKGHKIDAVHDFREIVFNGEKKFPSLPAFVLKDRVVTYRELAQDYRALVTAFLERGYLGKRIAIVGANCYHWILSYLASATVGVAVPIDKELTSDDIINFVLLADCVAIVGDEKILTKLETEVTKLSFSALPVLLKEGSKLYQNGKTDVDIMEINADEMSILIFTSGTTGSSKGVMLSQKNVCANINQTAKMVRVDSSLHSLSVLPLHHTYETTLGHLLLLSGGACISYCDGLRYVARNITQYNPSVLIVVPLLLDFILRRIDSQLRDTLPKMFIPSEEATLLEILKKLPAPLRFIVKKKVRKSLGGKLRLLIVGAAPLKPEAVETFMLLGITTYQGYGLTECSPLLAGNNDFFMNKNAVGLPIHGVEIKIENPNEEGVGEVIAKGDNIMLGYYNDEEATKEVFRGGYFHTGDLGRLDKDGFLYLSGRSKNVIVAQNGKNIYPEELEERLMLEPFVSECIVFGVPNKKGGTAIKAKIVPKIEKIKEKLENGEPSVDEIKAEISKLVSKINDKLPLYKKIIQTEIVFDALEKTTTQKIKRFGKNIQ